MSAFTLAPDMQVELFEIGLKMKRRRLPAEFIAAAVNTAIESEEAWYQMKLWDDNRDGPEGDKLLEDLKKTIEEFRAAADAAAIQDLQRREETIQRAQVGVGKVVSADPAKLRANSDSATYIRFTDLNKVAVDVQKFKDALRLLVDQKGGLNELSKLTGIPQPSLSRFFGSPSMPRRVTLLKIGRALRLEGVDITS
ncbi:MAG: hypothetical protein AB7T49_15430 [Oligoflexales bacterium]